MPVLVTTGTTASPALPANEEAHGDELKGGFPFRKPGHRHAHAQLREIFAQARNQDLAAKDDDRREQRPAVDRFLRRQHQQARGNEKFVGDGVQHAAE